MSLDSTQERCRTCLETTESHVSLHQKVPIGEDKLLISDMLKYCGNIEVLNDDRKPQNACFACIENAKAAYKFKLMCMQSETILNTELSIKMIDPCDPLEFKIEEDFIEINVEEIYNMKDEEPDPNNAEVAGDEQEENNDCFDVVQKECEDELERSNDVVVENVGKTKKKEHNCPQCSRSFRSGSDMKRHLRMHNKKCPYCDFTALNRNQLGMHMYRNHDDRKTIKCPNCDKRFFHRSNLRSHMLTHTGVKKHECKLCFQRFALISNLNDHLISHTGEKLYKCNTCGDGFTHLSSLKTHNMRKHQNEVKNEEIFDIKEEHNLDSDEHVETNDCFDKRDDEGENINISNENAQQEESNEQKESNDNVKSVGQTKKYIGDKSLQFRSNMLRHSRTHSKKCPYCNFIAVGNQLGLHMYKMHGVCKKLKCSKCDKGFFKLRNLKEHMLTHTQGKKLIKEENKKSIEVVKKAYIREKKHNCPQCGKGFRSPSEMREHLNSHDMTEKQCPYCDFKGGKIQLGKHLYKNHDDRKPIQCSECDRRFFEHQEFNLKQHMLIHTGVKNFVCDVCGVSFRTKNSLVSHRRRHTGEKPYKCDTCGSAFAQHSSLRSHENVHFREPKVTCELCGKGFARKDGLRSHMVTHTDVRPYPCSMCDKSFKTSDTRNRHMNTHTGERTFKCDVCSKEFNKKSNLKTHMITHTGERPHVCEVCGKAFTQSHCLKSHKTLLHSDT